MRVIFLRLQSTLSLNSLWRHITSKRSANVGLWPTCQTNFSAKPSFVRSPSKFITFNTWNRNERNTRKIMPKKQ